MRPFGRVRHSVVWGGLISTLMAFAERAQAEETIHLEYTADRECPRADAFTTQVRARTELAQFVPFGASIRTFRVQLAFEKNAWLGRLEVEGARGRTRERVISETTCERAMVALAIFTALAVDPDASTSLTAGSGREKSRAPASARVRYRDVSASSARASSPSWVLGAGVQFTGMTGIAPTLAEGLAVFVSLEPSRPDLFLPLFRLSGGAAWGFATFADGRAVFTLGAGRIEVCSLRVATGDFELFPCFATDLGLLFASASRIPGGKDGRSTWFAVGSLLHGRWDFRHPLAVEAEAGAMIPTAPKTYTAAHPHEVLFSAPKVAIMTSLGISFHFE